METIANNGFDIAVALMLFVGALIGLAVGFVRGGLFVLSWIGAGLVTIFGFPYVRPYARAQIENELFADLTGGALLFIVTLIVLFLISSMLGGWVRNSRLNALDRSLGMLAGLATVALVLAVGYMAIEQIWTPEEQPRWIRDARSAPLIRSGAYLLNDVLPAEFKLLSRRTAEGISKESKDLMERKKALDRLMQPPLEDSGAMDRPGYDNKERRSLDRLIEGN